MNQSATRPSTESDRFYMKWHHIFTGQWLVTALILAISLSAYGCADTASVSEDVEAPLASLTVTPGALQPAFFANTTNYAVNAPTSAPSVTVTAVPKDNTATVTINGIVTAAGQGRSVPLGSPGSTTPILIAVETLNGLETTYTVTVTRLLSSDNNLRDLSVAEGSLKPSPFNADTLGYTVDVAAANVGSVNVSAAKSDASASMLIGSKLIPAGTASGQETIPIGGPGTVTPISIVVTAQNGSVNTYQITVNHLSNDNTLRDLSVIPGPLDPLFDKGTLPYTVVVATNIDSVRVTAWLEDTAATMTMNGQGISSGQARDFPLGAAPSTMDINILVRAPNGSPNTYTITVNRLAPSSNANLLALLVTAYSLNPPIEYPVILSNPQPYLVYVATDVRTVTVTATLEDTNATMTIDGVNALSGVSSHLIFLRDPELDTDIRIVVTAVNGTSQTYDITVHRDDPGPPPPP